MPEYPAPVLAGVGYSALELEAEGDSPLLKEKVKVMSKRKVRELGEISEQDLAELRDIAEVMTMEAFSVNQLVGMLEQAWALGHNQGYADANEERDSK